MHGRCGSLALIAAVLLPNGSAGAAAPSPVVLPIVFHVAEVQGHAVVEPGFLQRRLTEANRIFAPYGVAFAAAGRVPLGAEHAVLETREDRDALGAEARHGVIDCFVVRSLRDVDDPSQMRRGVHWHSRSYAGVHFVILSSIAGPDVLAHELGHFLGNPKHSHTPGNLMSYTRGEVVPFLDAGQVQRMHDALLNYLTRGELRALAPGQGPAKR